MHRQINQIDIEKPTVNDTLFIEDGELKLYRSVDTNEPSDADGVYVDGEYNDYSYAVNYSTDEPLIQLLTDEKSLINKSIGYIRSVGSQMVNGPASNLINTYF